MKKGYYIHFQGRSSIGVSKKIDMQIEELSRYYDVKEAEVQTPKRTFLQRIISLFPTASIARDYEKVFEELDNPDFIYARRTVADRQYLRFWKQIKEKYPDCRIMIELFTYPYDKDDFGKWNAWPFYIKELLYRKNLEKYIDRFVTYTEDMGIFGVPTIRTTNGVNVGKIELVKGQYQDNKITLIGVAYMQRQHGYERVIEGLYQYYQNKDNQYTVDLLLIGDGPEKEKYQKLVQKYNLQEYVKFYPNMSGKQLDEMYDISDIALAVFGMYKVGFYGKVAALKIRECLAKGMPFITGCETDVPDAGYEYVRNFPNNEKAVDITEVVRFYEEIRKNNTDKKSVAAVIRQYASAHVSMEVVMKPVIDYIES
ncbi:MAG: glycosyltransferase [Bacillus sp. (in: Bacteria)]|nr:glycosyltransferase [Bacillus sp. (in: firmicutes)]MCM1425500.1 glycosyltransferase [Eubacterium sp.]